MSLTDFDEIGFKIDENDPKQLRGIIEDLLDKTRVLIGNLEDSLKKL